MPSFLKDQYDFEGAINIQSLEDEELLRQFELAIKYWHYNPIDSFEEPVYSLDMLRDEVLDRMG